MMIRHLTLLSLVSALALALVACKGNQQPVIPSMEPIGTGLQTVGIALVAMSVIFVLGRLIR